MLTMDELSKAVAGCTRCSLHLSRTNTVLGEGNPESKVMFVGEAPGADEDRLGRPFVGKAGQLLDKALNALNFYRDKNFYICNICKCRPENNRIPSDDEAEACLPYLRRQVVIVKPQIIVCLGATSAKYIIDKQARITAIRGKWIERKGYHIIATFHPAALLRDESKKRLFWEDLKKVKEKYDEIISADL
ncbi:MAG: uracil-DNA glycosylase [Gracilibacteraceae bacterium]|nr:uracil-DNA glycosylase [Gracilibacteraceae bacterium]